MITVLADSLDSVERIRQTLSGESESRNFAGGDRRRVASLRPVGCITKRGSRFHLAIVPSNVTIARFEHSAYILPANQPAVGARTWRMIFAHPEKEVVNAPYWARAEAALVRSWKNTPGWFHPQRRGGAIVARFFPARAQHRIGAGGGN